MIVGKHIFIVESEVYDELHLDVVSVTWRSEQISKWILNRLFKCDGSVYTANLAASMLSSLKRKELWGEGA